MLTEYEREREARVEANKKRLAELVEPPMFLKPVAQTTSRKRQLEPAGEPTRASPRLANQVVSEPRAPRVSVVGERGRLGAPGSTTCHSCRQKTDSYKADCTNCGIRYCVACLRVRHGQDAHDCNADEKWRCPRCEGRCICSACRRKAGLAPTGPLNS